MSIPTVFQVLVGSAIIFRMFLIKTFLHFVHVCLLFCVARCLTPRLHEVAMATCPLAQGAGVCGSHVRCSGKGPLMPHSAVGCAYPFPLRNEAHPHAGVYEWQKKKR